MLAEAFALPALAVALVAVDLAARCLLEARLCRSRAIRFCAWAFSVTFPLALDLVVVLLDVRANDTPERTRLETKRTKSLSRNVMGITATWVPGKILVAMDSGRSVEMNGRPENRGSNKSWNNQRSTRKSESSFAIVCEIFYRVQP
jgi:hypothetical protein